ncbi:hypothetical protein ABID96_000434 [Bacillus sp. OAE603]
MLKPRRPVVTPHAWCGPEAQVVTPHGKRSTCNGNHHSFLTDLINKQKKQKDYVFLLFLFITLHLLM